jgi:nucleoside-diphosphate-sugar epimerase
MVDVLIGGLGFLGVNLARALVESGRRVLVVSRRGSEARRPRIARTLNELGAEIKLVDNLNSSFLESLGGDNYYYLVGKISGGYEVQRRAHVYLLGEALEAASKLGSRLIYISSIGAVGEVVGVKPGGEVYEEEVHLDPSRHKHHSYYEITKAEGERLVVSRSSQLKGRWCIIRPGLLVGPWGYHVEWRLYMVLLGLRIAPRLGRGLPVVHVLDVAEVALEAGEGFYDGLWLNVVSPYYPDFSDLVLEGCRQLHRGCLVVPVGWTLYLGSLAPKGSPLALSRNLLRLSYRYSSGYLKQRRWRDVETMVRDFLDWAREGVQP